MVVVGGVIMVFVMDMIEVLVDVLVMVMVVVMDIMVGPVEVGVVMVVFAQMRDVVMNMVVSFIGLLAVR